MKSTLIEMLKTIEGYKHSKSELMPVYITERLNKSFESYRKELQQSILFLTRKHEKSILKRLNKIHVKTD